MPGQDAFRGMIWNVGYLVQWEPITPYNREIDNEMYTRERSAIGKNVPLNRACKH